MKKLKRYCLLLMIAALVFSCLPVLPVRGEEGRKVIKVGFPEQAGLTQTNGDGSLSGYNYDYLKEVAKYTNWEYEFVKAEGSVDEQLSRLLDMLQAGEIDILGGMIYTEELAEIFDYPAYNCGVSYYGLYALPDNTEIAADNYFIKSPLRVSVYTTTAKSSEKLEQFAEMSGILIEQVFAASEEEQVEQLKNGEADVMMAKDMGIDAQKKYVTIAKFQPSAFYFAVTKGNKEIVNELNSVLSTISVTNPYFQTSLMEKYFPETLSGIEFSAKEMEYIKEKKILRAVALGEMAPFQYVDENGEVKGISVDLLEYIAELTGFELEVSVAENIGQYKQAIDSGEYDLTIGVTDELNQFQWQEMLTTIPYLKAPVMAVLNGSMDLTQMKGRELALAQGIAYDNAYQGVVTYYNDVSDCLKAVRSGKADYTYVNSYTAQYFLSRPQNKNFIAVPLVDGWNREYCFGIISPKNTALLGILNKAIWNFQESGLLQNYLYSNSYQAEDMSLGDYIASKPVEFIFITTSVILFFATAILLLIRSRDKKNMHVRRMENERYEQISEMSNEFLFEYDIIHDVLKMTSNCADFLKLAKEIRNFSMSRDSSVLFDIIRQKESGGSEVKLYVAPDEIRWVKVVMKSIEDSQGNPVYLVGKLVDIQKEKEEREKLLVKAQKDALTGVYNVAAFWEKAGELYRDGRRYAFFVLDVDHFKQVNDTYGHYTGDTVLTAVGALLQELFGGERELVGRLGGDEFAAFAECTGGVEEVQTIGQLICGRIRDIMYEGRQKPLTASVGIVLTEPGETLEIIYQKADKALYDVKNSSRDSFKVVQAKEQQDSAGCEADLNGKNDRKKD